MQQVPSQSTEQNYESDPSADQNTNIQHGFLQDDRRGSAGSSTRSVAVNELGSRDSSDSEAVDPGRLDEKLRDLKLGPRIDQLLAPGQRISDYENALTPPTPKQGSGFTVTKPSDLPSNGIQIEDFPNGLFHGADHDGAKNG